GPARPAGELGVRYDVWGAVGRCGVAHGNPSPKRMQTPARCGPGGATHGLSDDAGAALTPHLPSSRRTMLNDRTSPSNSFNRVPRYRSGMRAARVAAPFSCRITK